MKRLLPRVVILLVIIIAAFGLSGCDISTEDRQVLIDTTIDLIEKAVKSYRMYERRIEAEALAAELYETALPYHVIFTDPSSGDEDLLIGGEETILIALIDAAQSTIDMAVYQFNLDPVVDALLRAHERGVRVRVVYDDEYAGEAQIGALDRGGIITIPDERDAYMHDKFLVADGLIVWTGSTNITRNGFYRNNNNIIILASPELADAYTDEFQEMLSSDFGADSSPGSPYQDIQVGDAVVEVYFSPEDEPQYRIAELIGSAEESIHFMSYVFTTAALGEPILERVWSGVEVAGVFESNFADTQYSECPIMRDEGVDARLDGNRYTMHHKVIIIDGEIVITGSFNYSENAITSNDENVLIIHSPAIAALYEEEFMRMMADSVIPLPDSCDNPG